MTQPVICDECGRESETIESDGVECLCIVCRDARSETRSEGGRA